MKIRLLKDKEENGKIKTTERRSRGVIIGWFKGTVMEVSDATGAKLIESGEAEAVPAEVPESDESGKGV